MITIDELSIDPPITIERCDRASEITEWVSSSSRRFRSCGIRRYILLMELVRIGLGLDSYLILFFSAEDDLESLEVAENIEPNDFAPRERAENIDLIDRPDSDLNDANDIVSPDIEP